MSKKPEKTDEELLAEQRGDRQASAHQKLAEEEGKYHGYSPAQVERIKAEVDPPDPVPTEESAAVPPNPEPEPPPPEPEPPARGRAA